MHFVEAFEAPPGGDLWLVFHHAGTSLHNLLYEGVGSTGGATGDAHGGTGGQPAEQDEAAQQQGSQEEQQEQQEQQGQQRQQGQQQGGGFTIMGPSRWWVSARQGPHGHELIREAMKQLLTALAAVHAHNVTHRCGAASVLQCAAVYCRKGAVAYAQYWPCTAV